MTEIGGAWQISKYEPLWKVIGERAEDSFTLTYAEIEEILGFPIDHAFLTFKKELPAYGYEVGKISMKTQTVAFKRYAAPASDFLGRDVLFFFDGKPDKLAICRFHFTLLWNGPQRAFVKSTAFLSAAKIRKGGRAVPY